MEEQRSFAGYVDRLADHLSGVVERVPGRCGGRPTFMSSRIPLEVIVGSLIGRDTDDDILANYDLRPEALTQVKQAMSLFPPAEESR